MANILVYIDVQGEIPRPSSLAALNYGRRIASQYGATLYAVLPCAKPPTYGSNDIITIASRHGADKALLVQGDHLDGPPLACTHIDALVACARAIPPGLFIFPATTAGRELGPAYASRMGSTFAGDASPSDGDPLGLIRSVFQRRYQLSQKIDFIGRPAVVVLSPKAEPRVVGNDDAEVFVVQAPLPRRGPKHIETRPVIRDLANAKIVVGGGRGLGRPENFVLLERYAKKLGAKVGATPGACKLGLAPSALRLGLDGQSIDADIYWAFGISGSHEHLTAVPSHTTIVAVNSDANAPIFKIADYGIVADAATTLTTLLAQHGQGSAPELQAEDQGPGHD